MGEARLPEACGVRQAGCGKPGLRPPGNQGRRPSRSFRPQWGAAWGSQGRRPPEERKVPQPQSLPHQHLVEPRGQMFDFVTDVRPRMAAAGLHDQRGRAADGVDGGGELL